MKSQLACGEHGGQWEPAKMWSLKGGVDLLIVALLQVHTSASPPYKLQGARIKRLVIPKGHYEGGLRHTSLVHLATRLEKRLSLVFSYLVSFSVPCGGGL